MKIIFISILVLILIIFLGVFPRYKKMRKEKEYSSVKDFRETYIDRRKEMQKRRESVNYGNHYITKHNSQEDYREK